MAVGLPTAQVQGVQVVEAAAVPEEDNIKNITTMIKYIPHVLMALLYALNTQAQSMDDLLRFVRPEMRGTARYVAMGGAFNALGGDLSAIKDNPAAAAVFLNSEVGITINSVDHQTAANYFDNSNSISSRSFDIDQFGIVLVTKNTTESEFVKLTFGYNYQKERVFNHKFNAIGTNQSRGLDDYFLAYANGIPFKDIKTYDDESVSESYRYLGENIGFGAQQAYLGYQSQVINPNSYEDDNIKYYSNSNPGGAFVDHNFFVTHSGKNTKHSFNLSTQYQENLYLGFNINSHQIEFRRIDNLIEKNYGSDSTFNYTEFENDLFTSGEGFSFQLGVLYKPLKNVRMGLSYQSPVWYQMKDELSQYIISSKSNGTDTFDPQITNIYEYSFSTPSELSGGLAYVFGTKGLLSLQYDLVDYRNTSFNIKNGDVNFINQNKKIEQTLTTAATLRLGAEYRINRLSLRTGFSKQESLHKSFEDNYISMSSGIGYDFGGSVLSLTLSKAEYKRTESMYQVGLTDGIKIKNDQTHFLVSYVLKL
ncbi:MAG: transporter [Flavobacteriaceae bacterium]